MLNSRYTGIDNNRDIQIMKCRHCVNLGCDDIPVLAITMIFKMKQDTYDKLGTQIAYSSASTQLTSQMAVGALTLTLSNKKTQHVAAILWHYSEKSHVQYYPEVSCHYFTSHGMRKCYINLFNSGFLCSYI